MAECPSCGATLKSKVCACGYAVRPVVQQREFRSEPSAELRRAMAEKQREVNAFVAKYQQEHPGATKREACMAYLPTLKKIEQDFRQYRDFDEAMDDYRSKVEA